MDPQRKVPKSDLDILEIQAYTEKAFSVQGLISLLNKQGNFKSNKKKKT